MPFIQLSIVAHEQYIYGLIHDCSSTFLNPDLEISFLNFNDNGCLLFLDALLCTFCRGDTPYFLPVSSFVFFFFFSDLQRDAGFLPE